MLSRNRFAQLVILFLCICLSSTKSFSQVEAKDYLVEIAAAVKEVIETDTFRIKTLDLGAVAIGKNRFSAIVKNKSAIPLTIGLDLRAQPGLWFRSWQNQFVFQIGPEEETEIQANYQFLRMTQEAWLRIRFGVPSIQDGGIIKINNVFFEKRYYVGKGNKAVDYDFSQFEHHQTEHFEIYCFKRSVASKYVNEIIKERESGYSVISELLAVTYPTKIRLFFFPDAQSKKKHTGHTGEGWAFNINIVEIYDENTKLDPFHEVAHIIAGQLGEPPALFNEGFATYSSERLGADALRYLGSPGRSIHGTVQKYYREGRLIPLDTLFHYTDIGPQESQPGISYPEAASFVKYLFEVYGREKFRRAYQKLQNSDEPKVIVNNKETFKQIYGKSVSEMEEEWLKIFK